MRGHIPSYSPKSGAVSISPKQPLGDSDSRCQGPKLQTPGLLDPGAWRLPSIQPISVSTEHNARLSRKEVIQPHLPIRLPCYDFTPVMNLTVATAPLAVRLAASGETHSHGVTGGVYKARERIHRDMLIRDY
jgi:hypothetical protein